MIARLVGLAVDARMQRRGDLRSLAATSRWVAANALALRGRRLAACGAVPPACTMHVRAAGFGHLLAALALAPSLIAPEDLPARWRFGLGAIGVPVLDDLARNAIRHGVPVLTLAAAADWTIDVERQDRLYVARVTRAQFLLAA